MLPSRTSEGESGKNPAPVLRSMPLERTIRKLSVMALVGGAALVGVAGEARADGPVTGTGKGIAGGALLGGEVATITMSIIGIEAAWPYFAIGGAAAVGGGIGGYFIETAAPPEVPLYMLAGGMALVIPTLVAALDATAYKPPEGDLADPSVTEPAAEPPLPGEETSSGARPSRALRAPSKALGEKTRTAFIPPALVGLRGLDLDNGALALGIPAVDVRPLYSLRERGMFGVEQGHEVRVSLFRAVF
jgi:hypothetical protein